MDFAIVLLWSGRSVQFVLDAGHDLIGFLQLRENVTVRHLWIQAVRESRRPVAGAVITPPLPLALPGGRPGSHP